MIIWSRHGYLVGLLSFLSCLLTELAVESFFQDDEFYQNAPWPLPLALFIAGILIYLIGMRLDAGDRTGVADIATQGRPVVDTAEHSFFFINMKWWGPILILVSIVVLVVRTVK